MTYITYIMTLAIFVPLVIITAITPYITRKTESFGVTIPTEMYHNSTLQQFRKVYAIRTAVFGIIVAALLAALINTVSEEIWIILFTVGIFIFIIGSFVIYFQFHKKMKHLKEEQKWFATKKETLVIDTKFYQEKKTYSNLWFLLPLSISLLTLGFTIINYDKFPDRLPMQFSLDGEVSRWADKSFGTLMTFPLLQLFMTGLFFFMNIIISRSKQQINPENPEESIAQNLIFRRRWSLYTIISGTLLVGLFSITNLSFIYPIDSTYLFILTMVLTGLMVIGAVILTILTGQGGSRVRIANGKNGDIIQRDDDSYWKLGQFYFNPNDPAVWVEKRFGSGWTVNFARPVAWITLLAILLIPLLIAFLTE